MKSVARLLFVILAILPLIQCGGDEEGKELSITLIPEKPIVIKSDFTYYGVPVDSDGNLTQYKVVGPWFKFNYTVSNSGLTDIFIQTIHFEITAVDVDGAFVKFEFSLDSGDIDFNKDTDTSNDQTYIQQVPAGAANLDSDVTWYIDSLPKTQSLVYSVEAEIVGWYGTETNALKSFSKIINFKAEK